MDDNTGGDKVKSKLLIRYIITTVIIIIVSILLFSEGFLGLLHYDGSAFKVAFGYTVLVGIVLYMLKSTIQFIQEFTKKEVKPVIIETKEDDPEQYKAILRALAVREVFREQATTLVNQIDDFNEDIVRLGKILYRKTGDTSDWSYDNVVDDLSKYFYQNIKKALDHMDIIDDEEYLRLSTDPTYMNAYEGRKKNYELYKELMHNNQMIIEANIEAIYKFNQLLVEVSNSTVEAKKNLDSINSMIDLLKEINQKVTPSTIKEELQINK